MKGLILLGKKVRGQSTEFTLYRKQGESFAPALWLKRSRALL